MSGTLFGVSVVALLAVVAAALLTRPRPAHTVAEIPTHAAELRGELGQLVAALNTANRETDAHYERALGRARDQAEAVIAEARRLLDVTPWGLFGLRHSVILAVAALRSPGALDLLSAVALNPQPLPPGEAPADPHHVEDVAQGQILALDALDGIIALAQDGHPTAVERLVEAAGVPSNAIRGLALTALAAQRDEGAALRRALAALPPDLHHLARLRPADVRAVPGIHDPRRHLAGPEVGVAAAPSLDGDGPRTEGTAARGAPLVRGEASHGRLPL